MLLALTADGLSHGGEQPVRGPAAPDERPLSGATAAGHAAQDGYRIVGVLIERWVVTGVGSILVQGMRGSLPTILSTGARGPTMLTAQ